ncbi:hypothetical protein MYCTH_2125592 [Thermothelomyces thermophilus ATCC 42464]|uniref:Ankyrin repeat protein n=1 Tax=Thermothelomyces thermophilus (strain ATCC 42464 / BCRC 31852 / DSM 1799) TaxID=573729 RepID=G2QA04_THET4|nr:uncharacterized protein MYCTH_2125592 [Thermothelomyces thermophilus ATCC 42464]AEO56608.1 hypothetical protein MYCTH_2125592 [Thermothelomyces thermophilus ATCC 42464]
MYAAVSVVPLDIVPANAAVEVVRLMCMFGADLHRVNSEGMNTLHFLIKRCISGAQGDPASDGWSPTRAGLNPESMRSPSAGGTTGSDDSEPASDDLETSDLDPEQSVGSQEL